MTPPPLEFLMHIAADLGEVQSLGGGPLGERRVVAITGGRIEGPQLKGEIVPGGADWQIMRARRARHRRALCGAHRPGRTDSHREPGLRHGPPEVAPLAFTVLQRWGARFVAFAVGLATRFVDPLPEVAKTLEFERVPGACPVGVLEPEAWRAK